MLMKQKQTVYTYTIFFCTCLLWLGLSPGCSYDKIEIEPEACTETYTFNDQIGEIISRNCSYPGCHDGASGNPGNFIFYAGVVSRVTNGQFADRVLNQRDMPPSNATGPTELTDSEINELNCWIEQGYPEE
jgi:hypothetical protein